MHELTIEAKVENLDRVLAFADGNLEAADCPLKAQMQFDVALEELFVNIAHYAYRHVGGGDATVLYTFDETTRTAAFTLIDSGMPYDPLARADPDITLPAEQRDIGGLGIYMVKKSMDSVAYEYRDGRNVLRIEKRI